MLLAPIGPDLPIQQEKRGDKLHHVACSAAGRMKGVEVPADSLAPSPVHSSISLLADALFWQISSLQSECAPKKTKNKLREIRAAQETPRPCPHKNAVGI